MVLFFSVLIAFSFCVLLIILPILIQPKRSVFNMSLEKQIHFIEKKYHELVKSAEMFQRDEIIERCVCKRNIRRKSGLAASKSARKCIELNRKSKVYSDFSYRIKQFLEYVKKAVATGKLNEIKGLKPLVSNIEHSLSVMSFDLLDLYLDSFESNLGNNNAQLEKYEENTSKAGSIKKTEIRSSEKGSTSSKTSHQTDRKISDSKEKSEKVEKKSGKRKNRISFESTLQIYKLVPDVEVDHLVSQLAEEVKMEDVSFMFKKT